VGLKLLLDSVIVIDHLNRIQDASDYLKAARGKAAISAITRAEVLAGTKPEHLDATISLLNSFPCLAVDAAVGDLAGKLRQSHRWKLPDALQAALAQHHELQLATRNTKDFDPAKHPFVIIPYAI
jgi:predicted nucleic acid-binding protein